MFLAWNTVLLQVLVHTRFQGRRERLFVE
ncbi:hypothetical protein Pint_31824 [Pistacia integerrima]|uniref:Uncharacterized protein n=1 Tax=Pistacia integerrima TaxID=434235 RepID=A0ACC0XN70_9ROSI|nr:hypothetical protein Pint_31824 [Pistacia integerrima]